MSHSSRQTESWAHENGFKMKGSQVKVRGRGDERSTSKAIQEFKRLVVREIAKELRGKEFFETKGEIARRKKAEATRRFHKLRREAQNED